MDDQFDVEPRTRDRSSRTPSSNYSHSVHDTASIDEDDPDFVEEATEYFGESQNAIEVDTESSDSDDDDDDDYDVMVARTRGNRKSPPQPRANKKIVPATTRQTRSTRSSSVRP